MHGGLHIEMAALKVLGHWLEDAGWIDALVQAKVATPGTAEAFLKAAHVTQTRHAHQVTASALYILLIKAYLHYIEMLEPGNQSASFDDWCAQQKENVPQFYFWHKTLELELLVLAYIRSLRTRNSPMYVESLTGLAPWFFSMAHTNCARWVPVHISNMVNLSKTHPEIAVEFDNGKFTV